MAVFLMLWMTACCGVLSFGAWAVKTPLHAVVHVIRKQPKATFALIEAVSPLLD